MRGLSIANRDKEREGSGMETTMNLKISKPADMVNEKQMVEGDETKSDMANELPRVYNECG